MKPGDCINIPAEVKHWHGAAADSWFSHLAVEVPGEETSNEWCEPVSDEAYGKLKAMGVSNFQIEDLESLMEMKKFDSDAVWIRYQCQK